MIVSANQIAGFKLPLTAWQWGCGLIERFGDVVRTEDGALCREIMNLVLHVQRPGEGWPIQGSGWDIPALEAYASKQILCTNRVPGFDYTYGQRLGRQVDKMINRLQQDPTSRRAVATTWRPCDDFGGKSVPCLVMLNALVRCEHIHVTAYFRSHDIRQAWPANAYGLYKIMQKMADELGVQVGGLTTISGSAHIYIEGGGK